VSRDVPLAKEFIRFVVEAGRFADYVWGRALSRTNVDRWPADKAADEAIARVKTIIAQWR
jgi:hypothetical protein